MKKLRVAFIGAGRIADLHVLGYRNNPDAELTAVCDLNPERAQQRAEEWGLEQWTTDPETIFTSPDIDIIEILTPHDSHASLTTAALEAGKHVSVQKPMALNMAEAKAMIEAAERTGRFLRVYENFRFYPPYRKARELLEAKEIGDPLSIRVKLMSGRSPQGWEVPQEAWAWRLNESQCGGGPMVFDHGYHVFSIVMYFMGPVSKVFAWIDHTKGARGFVADLPALIAWRHSNQGQMGSWQVDSSSQFHIRSKYYAGDEWVEITGTRGLLWINRCSGMMLETPSVVMYRDGATT
ncbi:MAG: Gfo/Idh/MocA family oxidoreductase, partial [Deltaproteobacteria bacterium]|nr:Gfo/Idh/MocA family oxidoreductase [Deltaproteobacteria bacterium]